MGEDAKFEAVMRLAEALNRSLVDFQNGAPLEDCHSDLRVARGKYEAEMAALSPDSANDAQTL